MCYAACMTESLDHSFDVLVGSRVSIVRFSLQFVEIVLYGGVNREKKYATLQLEADFELRTNGVTYVIKADEKESLNPALTLLNTVITKIRLTESDELSVTFDDGTLLQVVPIEKYEAWHLTGDDLGFHVAMGI